MQPLPSYIVAANFKSLAPSTGNGATTPPAALLARPSASSLKGLPPCALTCSKRTPVICLAMGKTVEQKHASWEWPPTPHKASTALEENSESVAMHTTQGGQEITTHTSAQSTAANSIVLLSPTGSC